MRFAVLGDLGGTNCRLELVPVPGEGAWAGEGGRRPDAVHRAKYRSNSADSLTALLQRFLSEPACREATLGAGVCLFSIAVCGPVTDGRAILLATAFGESGWALDAREMARELGADVVLLNDFHAVGLALPFIDENDLHCIHEAQGRDPNGIMACLGPGTGLGEVYVVPFQHRTGEDEKVSFKVCCSEGGMSDFVARTDDEWALRKHIAAKCADGFVEVEKVVSGEGIAHAYRWLREAHPELVVDAELDARILSADEPAAVIAEHGAQPEASAADQLCVKSINMFLDTLGAEAGNLAIRYQSKGGVFIAGGGIVGKMLPRILDGRVAAAFVAKGHSIACYADVPLFVASTPGDELGMLGAWQFAREHL
eukprot:g1663.t1